MKQSRKSDDELGCSSVRIPVVFGNNPVSSGFQSIGAPAAVCFCQNLYVLLHITKKHIWMAHGVSFLGGRKRQDTEHDRKSKYTGHLSGFSHTCFIPKPAITLLTTHFTCLKTVKFHLIIAVCVVGYELLRNQHCNLWQDKKAIKLVI